MLANTREFQSEAVLARMKHVTNRPKLQHMHAAIGTTARMVSTLSAKQTLAQ